MPQILKAFSIKIHAEQKVKEEINKKTVESCKSRSVSRKKLTINRDEKSERQLEREGEEKR